MSIIALLQGGGSLRISTRSGPHPLLVTLDNRHEFYQLLRSGGSTLNI